MGCRLSAVAVVLVVLVVVVLVQVNADLVKLPPVCIYYLLSEIGVDRADEPSLCQNRLGELLFRADT